MTSENFLGLTLLMLSLCVHVAVILAAPGDTLEVTTTFGGDCTLPCPAVFKPGVEYLALTWYKVIQPPSPSLNGILTKELPNGTVQWYLGVEREVELLDDSADIFIPNITCSDRGLYTCSLAAPVGEQNREKQVLLTVLGCPDESDETEELIRDTSLVVFAILLLVFALLVFTISYGCLKNTLKGNKPTKQETLIDPRLRPLNKKDLMMIATLGPKPSKASVMKFGYV
ncbi:CD83 antigen [Halichoeres trimaculatus]|uniref:CD83 antigen n=1 Tax=Halichoeres trimaculatus TaxID=147232 RepID=UPI003D9F20BF